MKRILRARFFGRLLFLGSAVFYGTFALAVSAPTGCTDISKIPVTNEIDFGAGIEAIFIQFSTNPAAGCASCHTSDAGPSGGLNLDPNDQNPDATSPYTGIVNVPSLEASAYNYVTPNRPELSYLFMKINCDTPPSGSRMPLGYTDVFTPGTASVYLRLDRRWRHHRNHEHNLPRYVRHSRFVRRCGVFERFRVALDPRPHASRCQRWFFPRFPLK